MTRVCRVAAMLAFATAAGCLPAAAQEVISLTPDTTATPLPIGQAVTWTAEVTGGTDPLTFQFWHFHPSAGWQMAQDYSPSATFTWTPAVGDSGDHAIQVWVRNAASTAPYDAYLSTGFFSVGATLTLSPVEPGTLAAGSPAPWTAHASGLVNPQYQFWRLDADGWRIVQPFSSTFTYSWTPTLIDRGQHAIQVWARSAGSTAAYDVWAGTNFFDVTGPPPVVFFNDAPGHTEFPWNTGVAGHISGFARGSIAPLEYKFWRYDDNPGAWIVVREYGPTPEYTWTPGVRDIGLHAVQIWGRGMGSTAAYEGWQSTGYFAVQCGPALRVTSYDDFYLSDRTPDACTTPGCSVAGTAVVGSPIALTAAACGANGPLEFQFWRTKVGVTGWSIVQDYSPSEVFTWTPGPAEAGFYVMETRARHAGSTAAYEAYDSKMFSVMAPAADLAVTITSPPITAYGGTTVIVDDTVTNLGPATSAVSTNRYILNNVVIGTRAIPALPSSATSSASVMLTLPSTPGAYYLTVENDSSPDLNTRNNQRTIAVRIAQ